MTYCCCIDFRRQHKNAVSARLFAARVEKVKDPMHYYRVMCAKAIFKQKDPSTSLFM